MRLNFPPLYTAVFLLAALLLSLPRISSAAVLTRDTVWQGEVMVAEDVLVPAGVTLTVRPGTRVRVTAAESTKTDPEYLSPLTEITIRGTLEIAGTEQSPVIFSGADGRSGSWAGIIIDGGSAVVCSATIRHADAGVTVTGGSLQLRESQLKDNRYGLVLQGAESDVRIDGSRIAENDYGLFTFQGARVKVQSTVVAGNRKKDRYSLDYRSDAPLSAPAVRSGLPAGRSYGDEVFRGDTVWQGRIEVSGLIRVPEGSRLFILPGTIVEFTRKDTTGTGIGENGLLIQGRLIAKGTGDNPIIFRSAEKIKRAGDWDAINIMNSAGAQNLIEHCRIEHAYRALHFHFSHVGLYRSILAGNYRGIQFQESQVVLKGNHIQGNRSGVQGRDSDVTLTENIIAGNGIGANFFRTTLAARGNRFVMNVREGLRIREGISSVYENVVDGNRFGMMVADMYFGEYSRNVITNNLEVGLSLKNATNVGVNGNFIAANGLNGLNVQESRASIGGNQISDNGERGIGIQSFDGEISGNNFANNRLYAIDLEGKGDVAAPGNWWGGGEPAKAVYDRRADPARGTVVQDRALVQPARFVWPVREVSSNVIWRGVVAISQPATVTRGTELVIAPGTTVEFSRGAGMLVNGRLMANGERTGRIRFTSDRRQEPGEWDEIQLEYATGSSISNCIFEYATWGLHSHFTDLRVTDSVFANNSGGMRFRSGPVEIRGSLFEHNGIGVRSYIGNGVIRGSIFRHNEVGIFVREKGGGLVISGNSFLANTGYGIRVGDFNTEDVNARGNWWGGESPAAAVFDDQDEPGIGRVIVDPVLDGPAAVDGGGV